MGAGMCSCVATLPSLWRQVAKVVACVSMPDASLASNMHQAVKALMHALAQGCQHPVWILPLHAM